MLEIINKILRKNNGESDIFEEFEKLNLPIIIKKKKKKEGGWKRFIVNIGLRFLKKKTRSKNDQEDEELIKDILRGVDKLRKK